MRIGDAMKNKARRNRKEESIKEKMSLYYLGRALHRFSQMRMIKKKDNK